ncbi:hypothetical protein SSBR45G_60690 [Bradyrhizobium sp. SSBR45G]|nr:hypothetical protein SSBR45G_60690 [Bradyrhizobium sp. SSBR45G]GLH88561.1 hypothetical protein SSBR45R_60220 [Bradyrhizobium sp. SSBR45R]
MAERQPAGARSSMISESGIPCKDMPMLAIDLTTGSHPHGTVADQDFLAIEILGLKRLIAEAESTARTLLEKAEIEAREREAVGRLQRLILEELQHRIKNTLATVSAIVSQSLRSVPAAKDAQHAISGRLLALGRAHDLLLQAKWSSADLGAVIRSSIQAFDNPEESRFAIGGPEVPLTSNAVVVLAMTLNELCTNALKFGALSVPNGRVDLVWSIDRPTQQLHFAWTERDGPTVQEPANRSFGTRLIETLGMQFGGEVRLTYASTGFAYTFEAPVAALNSPARPPVHDNRRGPPMSLSHFRVDEQPHRMDGLRLLFEDGTTDVEAFVSRKVMDIWAETIEHSGGRQSLLRNQYNALGKLNLAALTRIVSRKYQRGAVANRQHPFIEVLFSDIADSGETLDLSQLTRAPLPPSFHRLP